MLDQAHQQNQRLLDMPRTTPPPRPALRTRLSPPEREHTRGETPSARPSPATRPVAPLADPQGRHAPAHRRPAAGAPRGAYACRDAAPPRRRQELSRNVPGDAALWAGAARGARAIFSTKMTDFGTVSPPLTQGCCMARGRKTSLTIRLTPAERQTLPACQRATTLRAGLVRWARIILLLVLLR